MFVRVDNLSFFWNKRNSKILFFGLFTEFPTFYCAVLRTAWLCHSMRLSVCPFVRDVQVL